MPSECRDIGIWQGAGGDAARDAVQSAKQQAHTFPFQDERVQNVDSAIRFADQPVSLEKTMEFFSGNTRAS
jgi:hypothetical protein